MSTPRPVALPLLPTGVPGLDAVLGGGLPALSFNLISGPPGAGKTTLAHQIMFANASPDRPALYFTVMGEPPLKMLRYQQQLAFFDVARVGASIHFIDLSAFVLEQGLSATLDHMLQQVEALHPSIVIVDSFQAITRTATATESGAFDLQNFTQHLALNLTILQATTFLVGDVLSEQLAHNPALSIADGIIALAQSADRSSVVRKLQVIKSRGQAPMPGLHTFRIDQSGLHVYPRATIALGETARARPLTRGTSGVAGLDRLMGGGIPTGDAVLVSGPSGAGKSVLAAQFIAAGRQAGEPGVIAVFEEHPSEYVRRAQSLGIDLEAMERDGLLKIIYIRPLDLSPDEALYAIRSAVQAIGARRVVIDSLSGFELALAPTFRADFRDSLYRLVGALTGIGITVLMTMEIIQSPGNLRFSPYVISFLADNIILLRYVEIAGQIKKRLAVVKMRNSAHSSALRPYEITAQGMVVRAPLAEQRGQGAAAERAGARSAAYPGLTAEETVVLQALIELGETPADLLARRAGMPEGPGLTAALHRLVGLGYAVRLDTGSDLSYRPVAQSLE
ncbi:AAA family ATPase [Oscillochloris sp. ZM17-4]|uniref:ATPase domain-containing protein n=1 Tax=Oscillochloris sp. ZM17-4 TaxID=2866714 RepID=UPI001C72C33C|nr:ATPase domain-containing protein [Oscillochloris sp. ZM17-4]MBX0328340.1 AAA family ATPase [Oscillochloris sp. ZM17-4]